MITANGGVNQELIPLSDGAGVIEEVGEGVVHLKKGDRVAIVVVVGVRKDALERDFVFVLCRVQVDAGGVGFADRFGFGSLRDLWLVMIAIFWIMWPDGF